VVIGHWSLVRGRTNRARQPNRSLWAFARPAFWFFVAAILLFPIFAHGCHRGDHDDEPCFVPHIQTGEPAPPR